MFLRTLAQYYRKRPHHTLFRRSLTRMIEVKMSSAPLLAELLVVATQNLWNHISGYRCAVLNIVHP